MHCNWLTSRERDRGECELEERARENESKREEKMSVRKKKRLAERLEFKWNMIENMANKVLK